VWRMYYTDVPSSGSERIWLAEGTGLTLFTKRQEVLGLGSPGSWTATRWGARACCWRNGVYKLWYDGMANGQRHVGLATSTDGITFTRHPPTPCC